MPYVPRSIPHFLCNAEHYPWSGFDVVVRITTLRSWACLDRTLFEIKIHFVGMAELDC